MDTRTQEEAAAPLGVIGSLTAGFEVVGRHLWLIALPVMLDLCLWLGPRFSVAPLFQRFSAFMMAQPMPDPTTAQQVELAVGLLGQVGEQFNLLALLSALPLLDIPSLLARHVVEVGTPLGEARVLLITSVLALMAWVTVLIPAGLVLGALYLNGMARQVRAMRSSREAEAGSAPGETGQEATQAPRVSVGLKKGINVFLFIAGLLIGGMALAPLWSLVVGVIAMIAPPLGFLLWPIGMGLGGYMALHLLFVMHGLLLNERGLFRATVESFMLIQMQLPAVVGLILLTVVIYEGLGFVWSLPPGDSWTLLVGIVGNGCVATGLTAATFVFYQERIGQLPKLHRVSTET
jgi:hypothetical protein